MRKHIFGIIFIVLLAMISVVSATGWTVTANLIGPPGSHPSYFDVQILTSTDSRLPPGTYTGWCSDSQTSINPHNSPFTFTAYSTLEDNPLPAGPAGENWYKVNYILNNDAGKQWQAVQAAFWHYDGGIPSTWGYNHGDTTALTTGPAGADTPPGPTFVPGCNQEYAIVLYKPGLQTIFLETSYSCPVPEFPTMALPVGMLIGLVGLVFVIKIREH